MVIALGTFGPHLNMDHIIVSSRFIFSKWPTITSKQAPKIASLLKLVEALIGRSSKLSEPRPLKIG